MKETPRRVSATPLTWLTQSAIHALARRSRTRSWSGTRPRGYSRRSSRRRSRRGSWPRPCSSENRPDVANDSTYIRVGKRHVVQNIEGTAVLANPVTSSICRPDNCASLTDGGSIICVRKGNVPQVISCSAILSHPMAAAIGSFEDGTAIPNHRADISILKCDSVKRNCSSTGLRIPAGSSVSCS